ncbi:MAG: tRNA preQ1(34) S-adenosylmethionine ribosyltransferase-isomerase QueA [Fastidiosipilaceae bacterium]
MRRSDFYYDLPERLIAQHPAPDRDGSRLLIIGEDGSLTDGVFTDVVDLLNPGDCLVLNDTKVIHARLLGRKKQTAVPVEFLLLKRLNVDTWEVICKPGRRLKEGVEVVFLPGELEARIVEVLPNGNRVARFAFEGIWEEILDRAGLMPLPPYIHEKPADPDRYQTVYARHDGSSAAPTAGLHFTTSLLEALEDKGVEVAWVTLHVGLGTFRPVKADLITDHKMHSESYVLGEEAALRINRAKKSGRRVVCTGTTSCRVIESVAAEDGTVRAQTGNTDIFIYPGYQFKVMDALITNFHLPESTLIMLVSAFAGYDTIMNAYRHAVEREYRFFSFGDAMFIMKEKRNDSE